MAKRPAKKKAPRKAKKKTPRRAPKRAKQNPSVDVGLVAGAAPVLPRTLATKAELIDHNRDWVFACVRAISQGCASQGLTTYGRKGEDWEPLADDHPLPQLLRRPNPFRTFSELIDETVGSLELTGNAFWLKTPGRITGFTKELWKLDPTRMTPITHPTKFISGWQLTLKYTMKKVVFGVDEILHFKLAGHKSSYVGEGPLQAAINTVAADERMAESQDYTFRNAVQPSSVIQHLLGEKGLGPKLSKPQLRELRALLTRFKGSERAGKTLFLEGDFKYDEMMTKPREMDFLSSGRVTRDKILSIFGVTPAILGLMENASRANMEAAQWSFGTYTLAPVLRMLQDRINAYLVEPEYGTDFFVEFDSPVPENRTEIREDWKAASQVGIVTPNEGRDEWLGKEPLPEIAETPGDTPYQTGLMMALLPIKKDGEVTAPPKPAPPPPEPPEDDEEVEEQPPKSRARARKKGRLRGALLRKKSKSRKIAEMLYPVQEELEHLSDHLSPAVKALIEEGALTELENLGLTEVEMQLDSEPFVEALKERQGSWRKNIFKSSLNDMDEAIATGFDTALEQGLDKGESAREIAKRVEGTVDEWYKNRSLAIARTETIGSMNSGAEAMRTAAGVPYKTWLSTRDDRVRPEHLAADGQTVRVGRKFRVGGAWLRYPGDPESGAPSMVVNCRCASSGSFEKEGLKAAVSDKLWALWSKAWEGLEGGLLLTMRGYFDAVRVRIMRRLAELEEQGVL